MSFVAFACMVFCEEAGGRIRKEGGCHHERTISFHKWQTKYENIISDISLGSSPNPTIHSPRSARSYLLHPPTHALSSLSSDSATSSLINEGRTRNLLSASPCTIVHDTPKRQGNFCGEGKRH